MQTATGTAIEVTIEEASFLRRPVDGWISGHSEKHPDQTRALALRVQMVRNLPLVDERGDLGAEQGFRYQ